MTRRACHRNQPAGEPSSRPRRHRALARLVEVALGLRHEAQRAARTAPVNGKTAQEEIDELFA